MTGAINIEKWLRERDPAEIDRLFKEADRVKKLLDGDRVHLRGLVEFGNRCRRSCGYCGIRAGARIPRYRMTRDEILDCAGMAEELGYGTVVLQSGEDPDMDPEWLADVIAAVKNRHALAVTLSVGRRPLSDFRLWKKAGADRYLLKIETSDAALFAKLQPPLRANELSRAGALKVLREIGYEIGSGIIAGLPRQTVASVARDLALVFAMDLDMVAVGPFIPHPATPLGKDSPEADPDQAPADVEFALKALALARLLCPEANIPSTTALAASSPDGYLSGLKAGANVVMPNLTPFRYRKLYDIYPMEEPKAPLENHRLLMEAIGAAGIKPATGPGNRQRRKNRASSRPAKPIAKSFSVESLKHPD